MVVRRMLGIKRKPENCIVKSFVVARQIVFRMIKSSRIVWAGYVARMREKMNIYNALGGKPEEK
jgi:hypothetical protein